MLSDKARQLKQEAQRKHMKNFWLKKAKEYGFIIEGREDEAIKEAQQRYKEDYWERKARALE